VIYEGDKENAKKINYLLVLDFEANCVKDGEPQLKVQEIIEFPTVVLSVKDRKIIDIFHTYVKPVIFPKISAFCTELTGITQEMVDKGMSLQDAIKQFVEFLEKLVFFPY